MSVSIQNNSIIGAENISASGSTYGIVQDVNGRVTLPYLPGFYAYGIGSGTFASSSYMIFPSVRWNRGNHYNITNGRFTAPVAGKYIFWWASIGNNVRTVYRQYIRKNQSNIANGRHLRCDCTATTGTIKYGVNYALTMILDLAINDYVQIFGVSDNGTAYYPGTNSPTDDYLYFTGYLLA
jgi:hypothetical protein